MKKNIGIVMLVAAMAASLLVSGCTGPRPRWGYLPTATFGVVFADPDNLGPHAYNYSPFEKGGIVYTCRAGHIDIDHIRGNADMTRYLITTLRRVLSENRTQFTFSISGEQSTHHVRLTYPDDWQTRPDRAAAIEEIAFETAQYLTFKATTWHEVLTWFGTKFVGIEPEFNSAFSWEDIYSNLLGVRIGAQAMRGPVSEFNKAVTAGINSTLQMLQIQPKAVAIAASDSVRGQWYTGNFVPDTKMRHFDIGLSGRVTPVLIAGVPGCDGAQPLALPAPTLDVLRSFGLDLEHEIKPRVWEQGKIFRAAGENRIFPEIHYPILIEFMKEEARQKGYMFNE